MQTTSSLAHGHNRWGPRLASTATCQLPFDRPSVPPPGNEWPKPLEARTASVYFISSQLEQIRKDIRDFRSSAGLDKVIVLWTANTERFCDVVPGRNDTAENLLRTIQVGSSPRFLGDKARPGESWLTLPLCPQLGMEVSPSTLFAVASILEGCAFLNGSPQNTLVPGALELASQRHVFVGGDDFKSGQTKVKSVLVDFLIGSGLKVPGGFMRCQKAAAGALGW